MGYFSKFILVLFFFQGRTRPEGRRVYLTCLTYLHDLAISRHRTSNSNGLPTYLCCSPSCRIWETSFGSCYFYSMFSPNGTACRSLSQERPGLA
ncbi:hypothetical protein GGS20DRAFT_540058 [Poronia punctata]|nr:hypothetical protein GGS20DRAFT_540058 [Poronia punctata]